MDYLGKGEILTNKDVNIFVCNRVILVTPLATLLLSQWVYDFSFVLPSPTQHGILLAGLHSLLTREDVSLESSQ